MNKLLPLFLLLTLLFSCKKKESDLIWERGFGTGEAFTVKLNPDSGYYACGRVDDKPYFVRMNKSGGIVIELKSVSEGLFNSAWFDNAGYIAGGNAGGKMLIVRFSSTGRQIWEKKLDAGFYVDFTDIAYAGNGTLYAVGTASPDSSRSGVTSLYFMKLDTTGNLISEKKYSEGNFISANEVATDNSGNLFMALTRKPSYARTKASVVKFNELFQKMWDLDLYNNPDFGASSLAVITDKSGIVYVTGRTELPGEGDPVTNTFVVAVNGSGTVKWKKYLESHNTGAALVFDNVKDLLVLNRNCLFVNIVSPSDGAEGGRILMYSECDPKNTDALGSDIELNYDNNLLVAGSKGNSFYVGLKASQQ